MSNVLDKKVGEFSLLDGFVITASKIATEELLSKVSSCEPIVDSPESVQLAVVNQNGNAIRYVTNPSEEVQLAAVNKDGWAIGHIEDPSEAVKLAAVNQNAGAIEYIENPDKEVIELVYHLTKNIHLVAKYIED